ncbi:sodium/proline symporter PutP [Mangrovibacillus cuniculi]|uniref:Sodium/proline symporter n=1 Tax=Mangrovibacillus cuniculi TaxID=2593652 RepID=A0A7S8HEA2_9BACI|nr:sodium/proline symporter PutP [Mangrovibacillus cuniculi]QPC45502.1 sodium/proline symporter PutP [Mangrovibacillus cuniculi]
MDIGIGISLAIYFIGMLLIGVYAYKKSTGNLSEYMLGGRQLGPWVTAMSAGASDMSGWMLMGLPGAMYATGLSSAWIAIGLSIGAYLNYLLLAPRLRVYTEVANDSITIPDFLENRFGDKKRILRLVSGIVIIIFFTLYTMSGMVSGGTLFESAFGLNYQVGLWVTAGVVIAYTLFGGFLAVSLTDFVQGCIMFFALILVPVVAFTDLGGVGTVLDTVESVDPSLLSFFTGVGLLSIISSLAWGLGYFGQPHIIVRFMAIKSVKELKPARRIGLSWMIVSIIGALAVGLVGVAYVTVNGGTLENPETIFIYFSDVLFNNYITGFLLAAILAAIMSTISSQLLVTSSALTEDFYKSFLRRNASDKELVLVGRISVFLVAIVAILMAINPSDTILGLVGNAWAGFGAAFGPVILMSLYWKGMTRWGALAGMLVGTFTVIIWISIEALKSTIYEMVPGVILAALAAYVVSLVTNNGKEISDETLETFDRYEAKLKEEQAK